MAIVDINPEFVPGAKIKVIWVWGAGNKALNRMVTEWLKWVEFVAINTDAQDLATNLAEKKINIWLNVTRWLWAWTDPEIWRKAAEESHEEIKQMLQNTDMVFITAWMWGGTWTWAAPVVAEIAKWMGILTVWIVTKPFSFEWKKRTTNALEWIKKIKDAVDTLIVVPNDKIFTIADKKTTFKQAFTMIDKILYLWVGWITDLLVNPGDINIDFADIKIVMKDSWNALLWIGYGKWEKRAVDAARQAIENPLLETNLDGAKSIIFAVTWWDDLTPIEVQEAANVIEDILDENVNLVRWMTLDPSYEDEVKVTIIATWFEKQSEEPVIKELWRDILGRKKSQWYWQSYWWDNFITREINESEPKPQRQDDEDTETPAFLRKSLK